MTAVAKEALARWATNCLVKGEFRKAHSICKVVGHKTTYKEYLQGVLIAAYKDLKEVNIAFDEADQADVDDCVIAMLRLEGLISKLKEEIENEGKI